MIRKLATDRVSRYIQIGTNVAAVLFAISWFAFIGYVLLQGAYELGGLFILFTLLIVGLAYANERPE